MKHIYKKAILLVFIISCGLFWGCNTINPKEQVPTYIHIDSFHFVANTSLGNFITTSHEITSVWAYYNDNPIGAFDLPATFPVITNGDSAIGKLTLAPGIPVNGFNNILSSYPFYTLDNWEFKAKPGQVINYTPTTSFFNSVKIQKVENFESGTLNMVVISSVANLVPIMRVTDDSFRFDSPGVGSIYLSNPGDSSIDSTINVFEIPTTQGNQFLELNYKSTLPFYVGIQAYLGGLSTVPTYLAGISPSGEWRKFYVALQDFVAQHQASYYKIYIKTVLPEGQASGRLLLDNIQIVTF